MSFQAVAKLTNRDCLCISEITREEAEMACEENTFIDGQGLYLVKVSSENPKSPGRVLAKFSSEDAAQELAKFFRLSGRLEVA